jgi:hypothetical protein
MRKIFNEPEVEGRFDEAPDNVLQRERVVEVAQPVPVAEPAAEAVQPAPANEIAPAERVEIARPGRTRFIRNAVQHDGKDYRPGDEDALAAVLTPGDIADLKALGAISGDWE